MSYCDEQSSKISESPAYSSWRQGGAVFVIISGLAFAAYHNSFGGPFVFDDILSIPQNLTIRSLATGLFPPLRSFVTVSGRPLLNLSFALNYVFGGTNVFGYHVVNLALHVLSGLLLFGIVRRTVLRIGNVANGASFQIALAVAALWVIHPLQTESVTYLVQRAESLMAFFYLLTLYAFIRSTQGSHVLSWQIATTLACFLGMACKEVMATAPLIVLFYDRTFVSGSFREAWRQRARLHLALAATWFLLLSLVVGSGGRGETAGFNGGIDWWIYLLTQCRSVLLYQKLSFWPHPLVLDYGDGVVSGLGPVLPQALTLTVLLALTLAAFFSRAWRWLGFLGCWFFVILGPSSSVLPIATQTMAEHRMYLPLAAELAICVVGLRRLVGRYLLFAVAPFIFGLGILTLHRNVDYHSAIDLWRDTATKCPGNPRAQYALGTALLESGHPQEAIPAFEQALKLRPGYAEAGNNLGTALSAVGRSAEAIGWYRRSLKFAPEYSEAHNNLGTEFFSTGQLDEAIEQYRLALRTQPDYLDARYNLGLALAKIGRTHEAIDEFRAVVKSEPQFANAWCSLGFALARSGQRSESAGSFREALRLKPDSVEARAGLARLGEAQP